MPSGTKDEEKPDIGSRQRERALKHPVREAMLAKLNGRLLKPVELATLLDRPLPCVEYHYRVLEAVSGLPKGDAS